MRFGMTDVGMHVVLLSSKPFPLSAQFLLQYIVVGRLMPTPFVVSGNLPKTGAMRTIKNQRLHNNPEISTQTP